MISFFLEPATIAFAIPLYKQVDKLKNIGGKFYQYRGWIYLFSNCRVGNRYSSNEFNVTTSGNNSNCVTNL